MSDPEDRKSMDDVLASIRRIVRSEKDPVEQASEVFDADSQPSEPPVADQPLALTPDMRSDDSPSGADDSAAPVTAAAAVATAVGAAASPSGDQAGLQDMIRGVVMEVLSGDQAGELIRSVLKDELVNGETGGNISQNVMALIQAEVGKLKDS